LDLSSDRILNGILTECYLQRRIFTVSARTLAFIAPDNLRRYSPNNSPELLRVDEDQF